MQQAYRQLSDQHPASTVQHDYEQQIEDLRKLLRSNEDQVQQQKEKIEALQEELQTLSTTNQQLKNELNQSISTNGRVRTASASPRSSPFIRRFSSKANVKSSVQR